MGKNSDWPFYVRPAVDSVGLTAIYVYVFIQSNLQHVCAQSFDNAVRQAAMHQIRYHAMVELGI